MASILRDLAAALRLCAAADGDRAAAAAAEAALAAGRRLEAARGRAETAALVAGGPPPPDRTPRAGAATWGALFAEAETRIAERRPDFQALEASGGCWALLEALSDGRVPPPQRAPYYAQFDDEALLAALVGAVKAVGPCRSPVRRCIRNIARSPDLRQHLLPAISVLVADLVEGSEVIGDSAAALCNVACHSDAKEQTIAAGAVPRLLDRLGDPGLSPEAAEDLVACLGVLTGGSESGIASLFERVYERGREVSLEPLIVLAYREGSPSGLRRMVVDVLGGLCASSPQFKEWLVKESTCVKQGLPGLLRTDDADVRVCALEFGGLLLETPGFSEAFQRAGGIGALESVIQREQRREGDSLAPMIFAQGGGDGVRRPPNERTKAQHMLSKLLMI